MEFNSLDRLQVQGMALADCHCQKFCVGVHPWSPGLADACSKLDLMRALVRQAEGKWVSNLWIWQLQRANRDWLSWKMPVVEMKEAEFKAFKTYCAVLVEALRQRQTFIESLAAAKVVDGESLVAGHLHALKQREEQCAMVRWLWVLSWKGGRGTLTSLSKVIQLDLGPCTMVLMDKDEIKDAALKEYE